MTDYIYKYGNFSTGSITTVFNSEGYIDSYNSSKNEISFADNAKILKRRKFIAKETIKVMIKNNIFNVIILLV